MFHSLYLLISWFTLVRIYSFTLFIKRGLSWQIIILKTLHGCCQLEQKKRWSSRELYTTFYQMIMRISQDTSITRQKDTLWIQVWSTFSSNNMNTDSYWLLIDSLCIFTYTHSKNSMTISHKNATEIHKDSKEKHAWEQLQKQRWHYNHYWKNSCALQAPMAILSFHCTLGIACVSN